MIDFTIKDRKVKKPFTGGMFGQGDKLNAPFTDLNEKEKPPLVKPNPNVK